MEFEILLITLSSIGTAIWTVLTWAEQEEKERRLEQEQLDALYINPFLLATQELHWVLYRILVQDELGLFRREISHEGENEDEITYHEALAIVYVIVKYFGWVFVFYHYGSYVQNKTAIKLTRNIAETFADRENFGQDAFLFTFTQQRSLGQTFVKRLTKNNPNSPEFRELSLYQFDQELNSKNKNDYLYEDIMKVVEAIRKAKSVKDLSGWQRLLQVQNQLVDLLHYIELEEGFSVSGKQRKKIKLIDNMITAYDSTFNKELEKSNYGFSLPHILGFFSTNSLQFEPMPKISRTTKKTQIVHKIKGRIRLKVPYIFEKESNSQQLLSLIQTLTGVKLVEVNQVANSVTVYYDEQIPETEFESMLLETIEHSSIV